MGSVERDDEIYARASPADDRGLTRGSADESRPALERNWIPAGAMPRGAASNHGGATRRSVHEPHGNLPNFQWTGHGAVTVGERRSYKPGRKSRPTTRLKHDVLFQGCNRGLRVRASPAFSTRREEAHPRRAPADVHGQTPVSQPGRCAGRRGDRGCGTPAEGVPVSGLPALASYKRVVRGRVPARSPAPETRSAGLPGWAADAEVGAPSASLASPVETEE